MKKILLMLAMLLPCVGAWAQTQPGGPEVTFTNVQQSGKEYVLYINDSNELAVDGTKTAAEIGDAAKFRLTVQANGKFTFYNEAKGLYLVWKGTGSKADNTGYNSNKGVTDTYNATYCDWSLADASSASPDTYMLQGKRNNGSNGTIVIMNANGAFDAYGYSLGWHSNYSNVFRIGGYESITYNYELIYNEKSYGTQSAKGVPGVENYATPELPLGVTATIPSGKVKAEDAGKTFQVECSLSDCPIEYADKASNITEWYYLKMHSNQQKFIQALDNKNIEWADTNFPANEVESHVWGFVGNPFETQVISKATGDAIVSTNSGNATLGASATSFRLSKSGVAGAEKFCLKHQSGNYLNAQSGYVKHWSANDAGSTFIPVEYVETEVQIANIYATLYLNYQAYIPEGLEAYVMSEVSGDYAKMEQVEGILPANTGVVLKNNGTFKFKTAIGTATTISSNLLQGTSTTAMVEGPAYVLAQPTGSEIGLYLAELNGENKFQNNAGKAYLPASAVTSNAKSLRFNFGGTTAIESVLNNGADANAPIYDLSGRRVMNAVKGGIYIQNGKKFIVK